jgi:excisionase family DNA binding protein
MSDTARDYQSFQPATTEGLEDLFEPEIIGATQVLPGEGLPSDHQGHPVEEAAKLLGVSVRTVIKRLRKGTIAGFKVQEKFGEKWVVSSEALIGAPLGPPGEGLPGDHQGHPTERLLDIIERQAKELQAAHWRNGHLETRVQDLEEQIQMQTHHIKLLTDSQHKSGWRERFRSWFSK